MYTQLSSIKFLGWQLLRQYSMASTLPSASILIQIKKRKRKCLRNVLCTHFVFVYFHCNCTWCCCCHCKSLFGCIYYGTRNARIESKLSIATVIDNFFITFPLLAYFYFILFYLAKLVILWIRFSWLHSIPVIQ